MAGHAAPNIVEDGLVFYIDPINKRSWTGPNSSTVNDLMDATTSTILNDTSGSYGDKNSFLFDVPYIIVPELLFPRSKL